MVNHAKYNALNVEMNVSTSFTIWVGIGTLANARGLHFGKILLKYVHMINYCW